MNKTKNPPAEVKKEKAKVKNSDESNSLLNRLSGGLKQIIPESLNNALIKSETAPEKQKRISKQDSEHIVLARRVLRGEKWTVENLKLLYKALQKENQFNYARKILEHLRVDHKQFKDIKLCHDQAMCTYKDESLPADTRFNLAITVLKSKFNLESTSNGRTLGLMGAIYKGKWSYDNQNDNLERSLMYYNAGRKRWLELIKENKAGDNGYCAINAAFILDLLASNKIAAKLSMNDYEDLNNFATQAKTIRKEIIEHLKGKKGRGKINTYWINVTIAEAYFGLYEYQEAEAFLKKAKEIAEDEKLLWEYESTAQQLATLAEIQMKTFKDHSRYVTKDDEKTQTSIENLLIKAKLISRWTTIVGSAQLAYFILKETAPEHLGIKVNRDFQDEENFYSDLEELAMMCIDYSEADTWIDSKFPIIQEMEQLKKILKILKLQLKRKVPQARMKEYASRILAILKVNTNDDSQNTLLSHAIKSLRSFPLTIIKDFSVFTINSAAKTVVSILDEKYLNEKQTQLIFKLSINTLKHIHKYGYAEYAKMVLDEISKEAPNIYELKNSKILRLTPFGVMLFSNLDQQLYSNFMKELNYVLADNKLSASEKKILALKTKMVLTSVAKEQLNEEARKALYVFTEDNSAVDSAFTGKVGIALSGGGFRASLYHIGVLARMAELDTLRHVEVISCVSGGSIIGAYYYLALKKLLETRTDAEITREDYIKLVKDVEKGFLKCVQKNIRMRVLDDPIYNIQMFFHPKKTRSARLARLYEKYFYRELFYHDKKEAKSTKKISMRSLVIKPRVEEGQDEEFNIHLDNWKRNNKVPELILNATSLNTGHNWQFTATWMGEPSGSIVTEVDAKYRLRRMYYYEAPKEFRDISLGEAVAASSGVPGVFEPLELDDLYPGVKVQLVDGGVHDNQGIVGLLERECKIFFVSDASGQVLSQDIGATGILPVILRTNEVLQGRIREAQYLTLKSRNESALMKAMMFVHLRKDLSEPPVNWKFCQDPSEYDKSALSNDKQTDLTKYGIRTEIQKRLASVRTDLDSFNDIEAYALMYSGYKMTELEHRTTTQQYFPEEFQPELGWKFLKIKEYVENVEKSKQLEKILDVSSKVTFKIFYLSKLWQYIALTFLTILGGGVIYMLYQSWNISFSIGGIVMALILLMLPLALGKIISYAKDYKGSLRSIAQKITIAVFGAAVSKLFVGYFNRRYNSLGSLPIQDRAYFANLYLGLLVLIIGIAALTYKNPISNLMKGQLASMKSLNVPTDTVAHYCSLGLVATGISILLYFIWIVFSRNKKPS